MLMKPIIITGNDLTIADIVAVARQKVAVELSEDAKKRIGDSSAVVERLVDKDAVVYGVTTGFGDLANVTIPKTKIEALQTNLLSSHSAGVGNALPEDVVRATILSRVNTFAKGLSGIRLSTVEALIGMLNNGVFPVVPEKGSVGASGDLAPLAHLMLLLIGKGEAFVDGKRVPGGKALEKAGLEPIRLKAKEGLALINGTSVMTAVAALAVYDSILLGKNVQIAAAATCEALHVSTKAFDQRLHKARPHKGQLLCAENLSRILQGSELVDSNKDKVQDCYSLRCFPQVLGASLDAIAYAKQIVETELNSVTDNPLIFKDGAVSGGNFHGQPVALAADFLKIALAEIGSISERRIARLVDRRLNEGLPAFLAKNRGLNSGFMSAQLTASALVSENKVLAHPASVDSIPTSANQEDHVSMGTIAARQAAEILGNVEHVVAIELLAALQALEFRKKKPSQCIRAVKAFVRKHVPKLEKDRVMSPDIEKMRSLLCSQEVISAAEKESGELKVS